MNSFGKVGVLMGGNSAEREISLLSGQGVLQALLAAGVDAHAFDTGTHSLVELAAQGFARVFIALHGRYGEDGTIQGALELLRIPYTGSGVMAAALALDKIFTKRIWMDRQLATPRYAVLTSNTVLDQVADQLGLPLIIKPTREGSSLGLTKVTERAQLQSAYALATQHDDTVFAEQFIVGRELTIGILGATPTTPAKVLPIIEIIAPAGKYDYHNKYFSDATQYVCPALLDETLTKTIQQLALDAFHAIDCASWGRVDVMLRQSDEQPLLLEINVAPGMTSHSLVPMAAQAIGMNYQDLCVHILASAALKIQAPTPTMLSITDVE